MKAKIVNTSLGKINLWRGGNPHRPALLLLHAGLGDAAFSWCSVWKELSSEYQVFAPDLPGFGQSPVVHEPSAEKFVEMIYETLAEYRIKTCFVVGNSMGASIAYEFAAHHPEMVKKLVLVNGCKFAKVPSIINLILKTPLLHKNFVKWGYQMFFSDRALKKEFAHLNLLSENTVQRIRKQGLQSSEVAADTWLNSKPSEGKLETPTSIIWGTLDQTLPLKKGKKLSAELSAPLFAIPGAAHLPQLENPQRFLAAIHQQLSARTHDA